MRWRAAAFLMAIAMLSLDAAADDPARGAMIFRAHCVQCHGEKADGHGPLAARFNPPPANIAASRKSDDYMMQIVTLGGAALGRSEVMPEWGLEMSDDQIADVVSYLRQVIDRHRAAARPD